MDRPRHLHDPRDPWQPARGSYNRRLLEATRAVAPDGVDGEVTDLRPLPFEDDDIAAAGDPAAVAGLEERIRADGALLIATPEDNGTIPGVLQPAIDGTSRPRGAAMLVGKPVAVRGASPGGVTVRAKRGLRRVLANAGAEVVPVPGLTVGRVGDRFGSDGIVRDGPLGDELPAMLTGLVRRTRERRSFADGARAT